MIGPFLLLIGLLLWWIALKGKSDEFLKAININVDQWETDIGTAVTDWMNRNIWKAFTDAISKAIPKLPGQS